MTQVHTRFKVFHGKRAEDGSIGDLARQIEEFVNSNKVSAKSIGVEYLESAGELVMTIGYNDDEHIPIRINCQHVGTVDKADFSTLETAMMEAASRQKNIICHELYITDDGSFYMVFMTLEG